MLIGNIAAKPELRQTTGGKSVTSLRLATSYRHGENEATEWHNVNVWDKTAEHCVKYLEKGQLVYVEGRIQTRIVEGKPGENPRYFTEIVAQQVLFLGPNMSDGFKAKSKLPPEVKPDPKTPPEKRGFTPIDETTPPDDDLPF
jgi:single-strand DNA-binding protein